CPSGRVGSIPTFGTSAGEPHACHRRSVPGTAVPGTGGRRAGGRMVRPPGHGLGGHGWCSGGGHGWCSGGGHGWCSGGCGVGCECWEQLPQPFVTSSRLYDVRPSGETFFWSTAATANAAFEPERLNAPWIVLPDATFCTTSARLD